MVATGRCMMKTSGNVLRGGYNPQEKNGTNIGKERDDWEKIVTIRNGMET